MVIDIFRDRILFNNLKKFNRVIEQTCAKATFNQEGQEYDLPNNRISQWFNPKWLKRAYLAHNYPKPNPRITRNPKFKLILYFPNYVSLYLTNLFYATNKHILIEDQACGMARLAFYLARLGFDNFNLTENFTQISEFIFKDLMKSGKVKYTLNAPKSQPVILNLVGLPYMTRGDWPESVELAFFYTNKELLKQESGGQWFIKCNSHEYVPMTNMRFLCMDRDGLQRVFCREDKYEIFKKRLEKAKVIIDDKTV